MKIRFNKYQGAGNDFIIIDNTPRIIEPDDYKTISHLCDRRFGIGADGLILIERDDSFDFVMLFFNSDGRQARMCGNGGRCAAHFAMKEIAGFRLLRFLASDGVHTASPEDGLINLSINDVSGIIESSHGFVLNTGVPHLVIFMDDIENIALTEFARPVRYSREYAPDGVNVNIVQVDGNTLKMRTYERGVEEETLACGTGATASAIAAVKSGKIVTKDNEAEVESKIKVKVKGGELGISFKLKDNHATDIHLTGPATFVFNGEIEI